MSVPTDIFFKIYFIFKNTPSRESWFSQLSWETCVKEARQMHVLEYKESSTDSPITLPTQPSPPSHPSSSPIIRSKKENR